MQQRVLVPVAVDVHRQQRVDEAQTDVLPEGWFTIQMAASGSEVGCAAAGLEVHGYGTEPAAGAVGLYSHESPALYDDFFAVSLD